jgi:hypothetical protein
MEAPHAFRKNWPRKKARINRGRRRLAALTVQAVVKGADPDAIVVPYRKRGEHIRKSGVVSLEEFVGQSLQSRRTNFLPSYTYRPYESALAPSFARFLSSLLRGQSPLAVARASHLRWLLETDVEKGSGDHHRQRWLRTFLQDKPYWANRVHGWFSKLKVERSEGRRRTRG